jgi:hypothetical protein
MLGKVQDQIAYCHQRAGECRAKAADGYDEVAKQDLLDLERRWLMLARSYELSDRFTDYTNEVERRLRIFRPPEPRHPAIPRVRCPECGKQMRLDYFEPSLDERRCADRSTFACACGFAMQTTTDRPT